MVYSEQNYESEQRRQELLKNIQPGFYKPKDPADDTIVYIFRKRGIAFMQVLGSENTVELACRSLGRLETLEPFDVSETIEKLTRDLKWIQTRKAKLKVQNSPNFSLPQNSSGGTYYPSADAPLMDQQTKAIKEGWKKFPGLF